MRQETRKLRQLKQLLTTQRLSPTERATIEQQVADLEQAQSGQTFPSRPGIFGMFDRPKQGTSDPEPLQVAIAKSELRSKSSVQPDTKAGLQPVPELSPEEFEALAERIVAIADHIGRLRACWVTTLATEIDRHSELLKSKLQELARTLPDELLEVILGDRMYLVRQALREVSKPTISDSVQLRMIAPSSPSIDPLDIMANVCFEIHEPRRLLPQRHLVGYVPDGLQSLVA